MRAGARWPHLIELSDNKKEPRPFVPFPFFMAYAAAVLQNKGHEVYAIDAIALRLDEIEFLARVVDVSPDVIVQEVSTPTIVADLHYAERMKKASERSKIIFCGPNHLMQSERFLDANKVVDMVIYGEYEYTLRNVINELEHDDPTFKMINGIIYRDSGRVIKNPPAPLIENLDTLPWPARELFPIMDYHNDSMGLPSPRLQVWTSRGCPHVCSFCMWPSMMYGGSNYRIRKAKDVVEEIAFCLKKWKFKSYYFNDDTFNLGREDLLELAQKIKDHKINLPFSVSPRANVMDEEQLLALKSAGLYSVKLGIESGSQGLIDKCGKALNLDKVENFVNIAKKNGIKIFLTFTLGLPGETDKTIEETISYALRLDPNDVNFAIITPSPGSEYYQELNNKGYILSKDWEDYHGHLPVIRTDALSAEDLEKGLHEARKAWWVQKHIRNKEFDVEVVKKLLSFLTTKNQVYIFVTSYIEHVYEIIYALPENINALNLVFITTKEREQEVDKEFPDQHKIVLQGTSVDPVLLFEKIAKKDKDFFILPVSNESGKGYKKIFSYFDKNLSKSFLAITPRGNVLKKI